MAPTTTSPRLADLVPEQVAEEACQLVLNHLGRQIFVLSPACTGEELSGLTAEDLARGSDLGLTVQDLVRYAQSGDTADWGSQLGALDALQSVCSVLYSQAGQPGIFEVGDLEGVGDPETPLGLALVAAWARVRLHQGEDLRTRELAALGGCTTAHVAHLARAGEIERASHGAYSAESARRWLGARGVPGI